MYLSIHVLYSDQQALLDFFYIYIPVVGVDFDGSTGVCWTCTQSEKGLLWPSLYLPLKPFDYFACCRTKRMWCIWNVAWMSCSIKVWRLLISSRLSQRIIIMQRNPYHMLWLKKLESKRDRESSPSVMSATYRSCFCPTRKLNHSRMLYINKPWENSLECEVYIAF